MSTQRTQVSAPFVCRTTGHWQVHVTFKGAVDSISVDLSDVVPRVASIGACNGAGSATETALLTTSERDRVITRAKSLRKALARVKRKQPEQQFGSQMGRPSPPSLPVISQSNQAGVETSQVASADVGCDIGVGDVLADRSGKPAKKSQKLRRKHAALQVAYQTTKSLFDAPNVGPLCGTDINAIDGLCQLRTPFDWDQVTASADPAKVADLDVARVAGGHIQRHDLGAARGARKRWQVESILSALMPLLRAVSSKHQTVDPWESAPSNDIDRDGDSNRKESASRMPSNQRRIRIVDFGSGTGNVGLALATHLIGCDFTLMDIKERTVAIAKQRATAAGLANVSTLVGDIADIKLDFDIGFAVHACGGASDAAERQCIERGVPFVLVPCCVGKIVGRETLDRHVFANGRTGERRVAQDQRSDGTAANAIVDAGSVAGVEPRESQTCDDSRFKDTYATRSQWLRSRVSPNDFAQIASVADHNSHKDEHSGDTMGGDARDGAVSLSAAPPAATVVMDEREKQHEQTRRRSKLLLELDRCMLARENGYNVRLGVLQPPKASCKNDVIVAWPSDLPVEVSAWSSNECPPTT